MHGSWPNHLMYGVCTRAMPRPPPLHKIDSLHARSGIALKGGRSPRSRCASPMPPASQDFRPLRARSCAAEIALEHWKDSGGGKGSTRLLSAGRILRAGGRAVLSRCGGMRLAECGRGLFLFTMGSWQWERSERMMRVLLLGSLRSLGRGLKGTNYGIRHLFKHSVVDRSSLFGIY